VLFGWGIRETALFFNSLARAAFLAVAVVAMTSMSAIIEEPAIKGKRTASGQALVLILVQLVIVLLLVFLPYCDRRGILVMSAEWLRWPGLATVAAGHIITISAVRSLGRNYSVYVTVQERVPDHAVNAVLHQLMLSLGPVVRQVYTNPLQCGMRLPISCSEEIAGYSIVILAFFAWPPAY
jgi:protein-S-isoprenylcysteine O-methyltransferase Ste14